MPHFFISYAKKDTRELAISLSDALNALPDVTAWVDRSLKAGASWELQIQSEIDKCDYFVVLYSPDLNRHKQGESPSFVLKEISYTLYTAKKPIIPVMAQKTEPPFSLNDAHYIDYTIAGLSLNDLLEAICGEAGIQLAKNLPVGTISIPSVAKPKSPTKISVKDILPSPFEWCEIPAGKVTIRGKTETVSTFLIAKYPITTAQYFEFTNAYGYKNQKWWTDAGWMQKADRNWKEPRYWQNSDFNRFEKPIIGISWYESVAFCLWLSEKSGEKIMLPTEQQWQRAAQGDEGRIYPWGNDWDTSCCNNNVDKKGINKTSPVREYEGKGDSAFKVVDMSGNVWEWTFTTALGDSNLLTGSHSRILRGGSWSNNLVSDFSTSGYSVGNSDDWLNSVGFRIARSLE